MTFACGHHKIATGGEEAVTCVCGETRIHAVDAPLPTFRGTVRGPHAQFQALDPKPVSFTKEDEHG